MCVSVVAPLTDVVKEPPNVSVTAPADVTVPARSPAVPPAILVTLSEKLGLVPVVTALPGIASA